MSARAQAWLACVWVAAHAALGACATGESCTRDPITGSTRCQRSSGDTGEAVGTAVAAGVAWAAVGCTVNGCEPPMRCNEDTKMCERIRCDEGGGACPPAFVCDPEDHVCR